MAIWNYKRTRRRRLPAFSSSLFVLMLCLDHRRDATNAQESDAAKKCEDIKIGELIVLVKSKNYF